MKIQKLLIKSINSRISAISLKGGGDNAFFKNITIIATRKEKAPPSNHTLNTIQEVLLIGQKVHDPEEVK
ncbi:hypothetical protein EEL31_06355 [Brevibacillus laterosporus]|nr:hypothetical protein EEL31_06355 [Brevibacillus laterosporus]